MLKTKNKRGFTLLISIVVTSMLLLVSFAVVNIAYKQLVLANMNQESQYAFYNADSGVECAVYWDFKGGVSAFNPLVVAAPQPSCNGQSFSAGGGGANATTTFTINFPKGCAVVSVGKHVGVTIIDSKGYNTCVAGAIRKLERGQKLSYVGGTLPGTEVVWVEDSNSPTLLSATLASDGGDSWTWVSSNPAPYSGAESHQSNISNGPHQHYFFDSANKLIVNTGDTLFAYVYIDPANIPTTIMLQWRKDGPSWNHRAYWGADNFSSWGSRTYMGTVAGLGAPGTWIRLSVPIASVGLVNGDSINGMAYTLYGGRATWDYAGKMSP